MRVLCKKTSSPPGAQQGGQQGGVVRESQKPFKTLPDCVAHTVLTDAVKQKWVENHPARYRDVVSRVLVQ